MVKMKPLSLIALIFVLIFTLAACSNSNNGTSQPSDSPSSSASANSPTAESSAPAATEEASTPAAEETYDLGGREIVISHWWDGTPNPDTPDGQKALELQTKVEKKYNVKIKYVALDLFQTAEKVSSTVLAGAPFADIVFAAHIYPEALIKGGYVEALDDYMNVKEETKLSDLIIKSGSYGTGKTYGFLKGVPLFDQTGLYYNKRIFTDAGIPTPTELQQQGKWNWDAFVDAAKKLTIDKNGSGKIDQWGLTGSAQELAKYLIHSNNGQIFNEDTKQVTLDSPEAMEALEMLNKLFNEYKVVKRDEGNDWEDPAKFFREGKVAMYPGGLWEVPNRFQNQMADEYAFVPFPKGPKANDFIMGQTQMHIYMIPKGVKDPKMVYKIWEDLQDFENVDASNRTLAETNFTDEASVENALNTFNITKFGRYGAYSIDSIFSPMFKDISNSKVTPAAGVAKIKPEMQAAVDKVVNAK
jgi:multiple sugar transport system substrate-binding protein